MALETKIYALLTGTSAVATSVKARVYPVVAPQNPRYPFIVYARISGGQQNDLNGYAILENPRMQIDIYSTSYSQVKSISSAVHTVMGTSTTFKNTLISDQDLFEDELQETGVFRITQDYSCWNRE
jgi:hypothetical protein